MGVREAEYAAPPYNMKYTVAEPSRRDLFGITTAGTSLIPSHHEMSDGNVSCDKRKDWWGLDSAPRHISARQGQKVTPRRKLCYQICSDLGSFLL